MTPQPTDVCQKCGKSYQEHYTPLNFQDSHYCDESNDSLDQFTPSVVPESTMLKQWEIDPVMVMAFLHGIGELEGLSYGDSHYNGMLGKYWWRKYLHNVDEAIAERDSLLKEVERLKELLADIRGSKDVDFILSMYPAIDEALAGPTVGE